MAKERIEKMIGNIIRVKRQTRGLKQRELAEKLGISFQHLMNWERAAALPPKKYWKSLKKEIGLNERDFIAHYSQQVLRVFSKRSEYAKR
jgi:transcriptional regulator with XRE-family HTH domain